MGDDRRLPLLMALVAGALAGLALPPVGLPPLLWLALAPLWALVGSPSRRAAVWGGGLWGLAAVLVSHRWLLWLHPLDWIGVPAPLSLPVCLSIWLLCGCAGGLLVALWLLLARWCDPRRLSGALLAALVWGLAEVLLARGPLFWIGLGGSALPADPALARLAWLGGAGAIAAFQLLIGWCLWRLVVTRPRTPLILLTLVLLLLGHAPALSALQAEAADPEVASGERLLLVQPAIATRRKFEPREQLRWLAQLERLQRRYQPPLVEGLLLPEGSLLQGQPLPLPAAAEVLAGGFRWQGEELRSSLLRFEAGQRDPVDAVDKHRLVPLGEWVPLSGLLRWSGLSAVGGISPGAPSRLLSRPQGPVAAAICYEIADGSALARATRQGARWLVASANLDPFPLLLQRQYEALARLRSIETGRWLVSAANTGPSLLIDGQGRLRQRLPAGEPTSAVVTVQSSQRLTPYDRWGEAPLVAALALTALLRFRPQSTRAREGMS
ncbi:MAG: apolipoprotein N-acyltransferase [Cyanobacteriota bacterium]|nr:apolipoprotein N-acyltransferase [Cyanobacteriota bacterium]